MADGSESSMTGSLSRPWLAAPSVTAGASVIACAIALTVAGCGSAGRTRCPIRYQRPAAGVELLRPRVRSDDPGWPKASVEPAATVAVPPGALPLGYAYASASAFRGRDHIAAVATRSGPPATPAILLFDAQWHFIGEVSGLGRPPDDSSWYRMRWDADGRRLAVLLDARDDQWTTVVWAIEPPSLQAREVIRETGGGGSRSMSLVWAGSALFAADGVTIRRVTMPEGRTSTVYRVVGSGTERDGPIGNIAPSPDGTVVVFDRRPTGSHQSGLWALNVADGTCTQITSEDGPTYEHQVFAWEMPDALVMGRAAGDGPWDIYWLWMPLPRRTSTTTTRPSGGVPR